MLHKIHRITLGVANRPDYDMYGTGKFNIPAGVPIRLSISIEGVPLSAESIARLKILFLCSAWGLNWDKPVKISNIPISHD